MRRRDLLLAGGAAALVPFVPRLGRAEGGFAPRPGAWRRFEVTTRLALPAGAAAQAWIPLPSVHEDGWMRPLGDAWTTNAAQAVRRRDPVYGVEMLHLSWAPHDAPATAEVVSRFAGRDRAVDLDAAGSAAPLSEAEHRLYTAPTALIPTDGLVRETAGAITAGAMTDRQKARALYEWVVDKTFRKASVRGCGSGNVAAMLRLGDLGGKCADINALFVGLARSIGLPARDVYGLRVAPSSFGYRSLGANAATVTGAQHCRAEVYLSGLGWVPADPADVRKVALEEPPGNLPLDHAKVTQARAALFGAWETNWLAYNTGHDLVLPGSADPEPVAFFMYPEGEVAGRRLDCLDAAGFGYAIEAREVTAI